MGFSIPYHPRESAGWRSGSSRHNHLFSSLQNYWILDSRFHGNDGKDIFSSYQLLITHYSQKKPPLFHQN